MIPNELLDQFADAIAGKVAAKLAVHKAPAKRLLTAKEAAVYLGRSVNAIQHMTSAGELPAVRVGRRVHYATEDLDRWIVANKM